MKCKVRFEPVGVEVEVERGESVLEAAQKAGVYINSVCGGEGVCGKCRVRIAKGKVDILPAAYEMSEEEKEAGWVLACRAEVATDLVVEVPEEAALRGGRILVGEEAVRFARSSAEKRFSFDPLVRKVHLEIEDATVESPIADYERLRTAVRRALNRPDIPLQAGYRILRKLGPVMRQKNGSVTATVGMRLNTWEIMDVEPGDTTEHCLGVAVDIGTTTIVVHLVDLQSGRMLDMNAKYNSQMAYGEDYISRIIYAEQKNAFDKMQRLVVSDINDLVESLCERLGRRTDEIYAVVTSGNTAMLHFLLGLDPRRLRREPYVPVASIIPPLRAAQVGLRVNNRAVLYPLPGVAAYVGSDITAGVAAIGMDESDELWLFVDIGTNGEVVIGNEEFMVCCSCSAGPAFEGSGVSCGMRATEGAIEAVRIERKNGAFDVKTAVIGNAKPRGICGSGLLDAIAQLFCAGILGRNGKFNRDVRCERLVVEDNVAGFVLSDEEEAAEGRRLVLNEIDISNLIRSKAAVYAAIKVLLKEVGLPLEAVERFFLAGGFGNYINVRSAITIGMLPDVDADKVVFAGNTSVTGARMALRSVAAYERIHDIAHKMTYVDLMTKLEFMDEFSKACFLPHTDLQEFPSVCVPPGE
ncbi:MAG: ferredoxin [Planctomycetota bacterium]|nr:MAG: ferredoxin [Planctomycetota bacterium]